MTRIVFIFGIIAGLICGGMFFIMAPEDGQLDFSRGALYGYVTMFIALSTIFFAVKQYKDKHGDGHIKFGKAFLIGLYITLIAGAIYVITWELYFNNYAPDFAEQYVNYLEEELVAKGTSPAEVEAQIKPQREMMESYSNNTLMRVGFTLMEIVPVGLFISLVSALIFGVWMNRKTSA